MPESSISRLVDETVVVQVLGSPPQLVQVTESVTAVLPVGQTGEEVLLDPGGVPVVATLAVPPTQVVVHPDKAVLVTTFQPGLPGLNTSDLDLIIQTATDVSQAVADAAILSVLEASAFSIRYDAAQGLTEPQIKQAWENLGLADVDIDLVALMDAAL